MLEVVGVQRETPPTQYHQPLHDDCLLILVRTVVRPTFSVLNFSLSNKVVFGIPYFLAAAFRVSVLSVTSSRARLIIKVQ